MWRVEYTRPKRWVPFTGCVFALILASGCERTPDFAVRIGGVGVQEEVIGSLAPPEREMLADLVGLSLAISRDEVDALGAPIVERMAEEARAEAWPYWLAAREQGWGDAELRAAYQEQPEWELVVRHVVRLAGSEATQAARDSARIVAERVAERAVAGEDFAALAAEFSEEPGAASRGGLLQPGRRGSWVETFWRAAESLSPGQVSGVVQTEYGFHVLRLDERRPVPFEEASRTRLVRRIVPEALATRAGEQWHSGPGAVRVDDTAATAALDQITAAESVPEELTIATGPGGEYKGRDLVAGWALLEPGTRAALESGGLESFLGWLEDDARVVLQAAAAEEAGFDIPRDARTAAETDWFRRVGGWAQGLGLRPEAAGDQEILSRARESLLSGAPEARAARQEIRSLRPRLRELYPVTAEP